MEKSATQAAKANAATQSMIDIYRQIRQAGRGGQEQFKTLLAHANVLLKETWIGHYEVVTTG